MSKVSLSQPGLLKGSFTPAGDKSVSHRALMFGALAEGESRYTNFLHAEDCLSTMKTFEALGVSIDYDQKEKSLSIQGKGLRSLQSPSKELYVGNSGTTMRLMLGILAGQRLSATLSGDESLSARPMKRVTQPLKQMGAQIKGAENGNFAPLSIQGGKLKAIEYENKLGSAQVKSAILFAGLFAEGITKIQEIYPSRDHTERMLLAAGAPLETKDDWLWIQQPTEGLKPLNMAIPGDISSAAFFIAGAAMIPGSDVWIKNVGINPHRIGLIEVLQRMGALIEVEQTAVEPEPIGNIHIEGTRLKGTRIVKQEIPGLIDELPILMVAMALAEGESLISGAEELRVKETDRIMSMVNNLNAIGGRVDELPDGCVIQGVENFTGGTVQSFGDHRTAMSMTIASLCAKGEVTVEDTDCILTSFPDFFEVFEELRQ